MFLWCDGAHDPAENMRRDEALLAAAATGAAPVLRLFSFRPHGITLGANQDPERELDLAQCEADQVPWAIRPSGGRAIFHAEEWTYALATPADDPDWGGDTRTSYLRVSERIASSLRRLGVPARVAAGGVREVASHPRARGGPASPCFSSTARHEVVLDGRKLVGSAQRRRGGAILQEGSILLGAGHLRLADYLAIPDARRAGLRDELNLATCHAGRWLGPETPLASWAEALEHVLGPGVRRLEGDAGPLPLTLPKPRSYTSAALQAKT